MKTTEQINELAAALAKAQKSISPVIKDQTANVASKKGEGSSYRYQYADLAGIWSACRDALADQGIAVIQDPEVNGQNVTIRTRLIHASGQWVEGEMTLNAGSAGIQVIGSAITYGRRYSLMSFLVIAPEDDDGGRAQAAAEVAEQRQSSQQSRQSRSQSKPQPGANGNRSSNPPAPNPAQKPVETPPVSQPKPQQSAEEKELRSLLYQAGCEKASQARLILNWITIRGFGSIDPLEAIKDPTVAAATLEKLKADPHGPSEWLKFAEYWQQQEGK